MLLYGKSRGSRIIIKGLKNLINFCYFYDLPTTQYYTNIYNTIGMYLNIDYFFSLVSIKNLLWKFYTVQKMN